MWFFRRSRRGNASLIRAFVFGVEDSVVSTVGLLSGVVVGGVEQSAVLIAGVVLIFVEAFSMGAGEFLSDASAEDYMHQKDTIRFRPLLQGVTMFTAYFVTGFVVLAPYMLFSLHTAFWISIVVALLLLILLGAGNASVSGVSPVRSALRMLLVGGLALLIGIIAATVFKGAV